MNASTKNERIIHRIHVVLDDYAHVPQFAEIRRDFVRVLTQIDELLPDSGEKTFFLRRMLEGTHALMDAVEMSR